MSKRHGWIALVITLFCFTASNAHSDSLPDPDSAEAEALRGQFLDAEKAISKGQISKARKIMQDMGNYALLPYLELEIMLRNLYRVPAKKVEAFIDTHQNTWAGEKARLNWLSVLGSRRKNNAYIAHYQQVEANTILQCQYLQALIRTGRKEEAYRQVPNLWLSGTSQPDVCDPLFSAWRKSTFFDEEYIWKRFLLARKAREYSLARYLSSLPKDPAIKQRIRDYHRVRRNPALITNANNFDLKDPGISGLLEYGIRRQATKNPAAVYKAFQQYMKQGVLDAVSQQLAIEGLMKGWTRNGELNKALVIAQEYPESIREQQLDWQLQQSLGELDWQSVLNWYELLDDESKSSDKWQYWIARAKSQLGQSAQAVFTNLSNKRSYYGHLSNLLMETPFHLHDDYQPSDPALVEQIKSSLGVQQALELDRIGYYLNSRNAWNVTLAPLSEYGQIAAGQAAHELGLHYSGIVSMARAGSWNNLTVRFPLAYREHFEKAAKQQGISPAWVIGISRQESSFAPDIRSSAGARGLMQVLPSTAKEMARKIGVAYDRARLREPAYNIPLGAAYLKQGMEDLNGNMIYATAGYNAGIHRATTWLRNGKNRLPLDVWVEIIPVKETRQYVKNVMDYSTIYADKLGIEAPLQTLDGELFVATN